MYILSNFSVFIVYYQNNIYRFYNLCLIIREGGRTNYSTLTGPELVLGTPDCMSPEMVRGEKIDLRSDIYELGIVLYQMLVGDVPFRDDNPYTVLLKRLQEPVPLSL
jgi:serine/threonine protein kinase